MAKKKKWVKMRITRYELNPEQAVLSCCDNITKNRMGYSGNTACDGSIGNCNPNGSGSNITSS